MEDGMEEEEEQESAGDNQGSADTFNEKWGWTAAVDVVSETYRCSWDDVYQMPVLQFLNILAYRKDKIAHEKAEIDRWKRTH